MTEVAFHFNAPDSTAYTCRLVRKALSKGSKVVITGPTAQLLQLDADLWSMGEFEFLPHCKGNAPPEVLAASPVVLTQALDKAPHHQVLVNLGAQVPTGFERFERLLEVVTLDEDNREQARQRWKHYADRGYAIQRHDLKLKEFSP